MDIHFDCENCGNKAFLNINIEDFPESEIKAFIRILKEENPDWLKD